MKTLAAVVACVLAFALDANAEEPFSAFDNSAIVWRYENQHVWPEMKPPAHALVLRADRRVDDYLLRSLEKEGEFVAAHVVLHHRWSPDFETRPGHSWAGLRYRITADGAVRIEENQVAEISSRWRKFLEGAPLVEIRGKCASLAVHDGHVRTYARGVLSKPFPLSDDMIRSLPTIDGDRGWLSYVGDSLQELIVKVRTDRGRSVFPVYVKCGTKAGPQWLRELLATARARALFKSCRCG